MHKYLKELGIKQTWEDWLEEENVPEDPEKIERYNIFKKQLAETGHCSMEVWNMDTTVLENVYELTKLYLETADVDLTYHTFEFKGSTYTQEQMINMMLDRMEFILAEPDNIEEDKRKELFERNEFFKKYKEYDDWNEEHNEIYKEIWQIWGLIFPAMWW